MWRRELAINQVIAVAYLAVFEGMYSQEGIVPK